METTCGYLQSVWGGGLLQEGCLRGILVFIGKDPECGAQEEPAGE